MISIIIITTLTTTTIIIIIIVVITIIFMKTITIKMVSTIIQTTLHGCVVLQQYKYYVSENKNNAFVQI